MGLRLPVKAWGSPTIVSNSKILGSLAVAWENWPPKKTKTRARVSANAINVYFFIKFLQMSKLNFIVWVRSRNLVEYTPRSWNWIGGKWSKMRKRKAGDPAIAPFSNDTRTASCSV